MPTPRQLGEGPPILVHSGKPIDLPRATVVTLQVAD